MMPAPLRAMVERRRSVGGASRILARASVPRSGVPTYTVCRMSIAYAILDRGGYQ